MDDSHRISRTFLKAEFPFLAYEKIYYKIYFIKLRDFRQKDIVRKEISISLQFIFFFIYYNIKNKYYTCARVYTDTHAHKHTIISSF